ncbi:unnamed protein product [Lactuca saligna]|uniref:K Homology domain-containing protein n=1 Tax=Lactuca saligna TaxID=75948 RepID=A0AA36E3L6_LACSI|nr:unnamed protein product [Lactuca saligna]
MVKEVVVTVLGFHEGGDPTLEVVAVVVVRSCFQFPPLPDSALHRRPTKSNGTPLNLSLLNSSNNFTAILLHRRLVWQKLTRVLLVMGYKKIHSLKKHKNMILVPAQKVGSIIGRKGEFIKKMCEETGARIKILDAPPGTTTERAVMISGKEEPDASLPPAVDGLLRVHKRTVDGLDGESFPVPVPPGFIKVSTRLLVPAVQAGSLIGKQGATVKSIQEASSCIVRVLEDLPSFALQDDRIVEVVGKPGGIHKAVELIASHLRKFLVDRSVISLFEVQMQAPKPQMEQQIPPPESWGPPPHFMAPPRQIDTYYPPPEIQPHQGISAYGREAHVAMQATTTAPSVITQVTQQMQIPLSYADAVIGTAGSNISYIRRASSATISVQETKGVPGEMTVEFNGTASQVQTAQQLIQNFMADAAASTAAAPPPQPPPQIQTSTSEQGYNPYAAHATMYASPPTTSYGGQTGGYGSIYGANYGY